MKTGFKPVAIFFAPYPTFPLNAAFFFFFFDFRAQWRNKRGPLRYVLAQWGNDRKKVEV